METILVYTIFCISFLVLGIRFLLQNKNKSKNIPPSPPALPIIGHLHLLNKQAPIHQIFHNLSQKHGPIMSLQLGSRFAVVVSSQSAIEECFAKNDIVFANRPPFLFGKHIGYNYTDLVGASYGNHWRNLRRLTAIEIFSSTRLNNFLDIRKDEVKMLLQRLLKVSRDGFVKVDLRSMFVDLTSNIIMRMVAGKRYQGEDVTEVEEAQMFREIVQEIMELTGATALVDLFPALRWVDYGGFEKRMVRVGKKADLFWQGLIEEHRGDEIRNTMISHLLSLQKLNPEYYTDEIIKGLIMILLTAGTETTATSLEWAMCNLLNNPDTLNKAEKELATQLGEDRSVDEADIAKLPYLQYIIRENLRLYPVAPILLPHWSSDHCTIGGYDIPPNTMLFVNAWEVQRDPNLWDDPTSFNPERFENSTSSDQACKFMPFGLGRRACPGEGMALRVMGLVLGSLIQCFEWERVGGEKIDTTEKTVLVMSKVEPLEVMCKARPILHKFLS